MKNILQLPPAKRLPVNLLVACFNNTSATYKYYWLLSILQIVENGNSRIYKRDLFAGMIANAWYTVNYFHVSFGKQDKLQRAIELIKDFELLMIDDSREKILKTLSATTNKNSIGQLNYFNKQVPHWFLSPWFPKLKGETDSQQEKRIYSESKKAHHQCLYSLQSDFIEINPQWIDYLTENIKLLKNYCHWNLAIYLQAKNPNVPDIPNKIIKPALRNSLVKQRNLFWDIVFKEVGSVECIYTGNKLVIGNYAVEHFIPYSFVSHDLIWNLIPADKSFNCSKSDKLPSLDKYYDSFFKLQQVAIGIIKNKSPKNKFLEDYLSIFPDIDGSFTKQNFKERIQPLITIASNNGFQFLQ